MMNTPARANVTSFPVQYAATAKPMLTSAGRLVKLWLPRLNGQVMASSTAGTASQISAAKGKNTAPWSKPKTVAAIIRLTSPLVSASNDWRTSGAVLAR